MITIAILLIARDAGAQAAIPGYNSVAKLTEQVEQNHWKLTGAVEIEQGNTKLYADEVEYFGDRDLAIAKGNVAFSQGNNSIAADRAEFNTKTRLGTFYNASGIATIQPPRQIPAPGTVVAPTRTGEVTDVYFFGDVVEKVGPKKYKITNGGFSTCVQPTPRWDLHAGTVLLNIDHYTLLKQAIFNVKGVPMLYVPFIYYPTKEDGRATGFLIPTYGSSSIRGQSIHNAFFWAISRSQDATIMHDWYSKTGQAYGTEYRYNRGTGDGVFQGQLVNDRETTYSNGGVLPASRSYDIRGSANQILSPHLRARANIDYFSSVTTMQTFNTNLYDASRSNRTYGANVVGYWRTYSLNGTFNRTEHFTSTTTSSLGGESPRIVLSRNERLLSPASQLYFSGQTEFVHFDRRADNAGAVLDTGLSRFDLSPQIRYPFKKWQWFTVNSTVQWRDTVYTRSFDPVANAVIDSALNRQYFNVQATATGPVLSRVWNTPNNRYAEKFKHTIEPVFSVSRTSTIENFDRIVKMDGIDQIFGTLRYDYGLNNRIYAKRKVRQLSQAQEILTVSLNQSYYADKRASQFDRSYPTSFQSGQQTNFSPVLLRVRATPTPSANGNFSAEFDSKTGSLRRTDLNGGYNWITHLQTQIGWSRMYFIKDLPGFNNRSALSHWLNGSVNAQTRDNRYGLRYSFNYDVLNSTMVQQTIVGYYNAQCCGVAFQYSPRKFAGTSTLPTNRSFFISFTLAGLGSFSPLNGALGGLSR